MTAPPVNETVSVLLRRQVPIRWDDPSSSWIGGLPRMPENIEWPLGPSTRGSESGVTPLHFVAQICCADLPPELRGGLGPRSGWLLLFLNALDCQNETVNEGGVRVLHILEPGPERAPPQDICPVRDFDFSAGHYEHDSFSGEIPLVWRRWPVDLITIPNRLEESPERTQALIPKKFSSILYGRAVVHEGDVELREMGGLSPELAADYYVSPQLYHCMPDEIIALMEPHWRAIQFNRPHCMGGIHDVIQSDACEGPTKSVLLFQIATDNVAMDWFWGDGGAWLIFIDTDRLAAGDFSRIDAKLECG